MLATTSTVLARLCEADDLAGWGLPQLRPGLATPAEVECVLMKANELAEAGLHRGGQGGQVAYVHFKKIDRRV